METCYGATEALDALARSPAVRMRNTNNMQELGSAPLDQGHFSVRAVLRPGLKRAMDVAGAALLLLFMAPLLLLLAVAVARDGGPILAAHRRVGRGGREFGCLKFRTAPPRTEQAAAEPAEARDAGAMTIGRALRAANLDELPQLLNVLFGDMSLVGPRPVSREELEGFYAPIGAIEAYLSLRPGVTGPWQVTRRADNHYTTCIGLDAAYARSLSLRADLVIMARTAGSVLRRRGAH